MYVCTAVRVRNSTVNFQVDAALLGAVTYSGNVKRLLKHNFFDLVSVCKAIFDEFDRGVGSKETGEGSGVDDC